MNIIISGFGKMGRLIEECALSRGYKITAVVDPMYKGNTISGSAVYKSISTLPRETLPGVILIDFSHPSAAFNNIKSAVELKIPMVVGTTGWYEKLDEVKNIVKLNDGALLYAPNFALGVQLFYKAAAFAVSLIDKFDDYDVAGFEAHHNKKADSPSGTAKHLAEIILKNSSRKKRAVYDKLERPPAEDELHVASLRIGSVPGTHSIIFDSDADSIEITHTSRSRAGLVSGAVFAAAWLKKCFYDDGKRGIFTLEDVIQ